MNLQDTKYSQSKGLCEDLTEGRFSFPIIYGIRVKQDNQLLLNVLRQRTEDAMVKQQTVHYLRDIGVFSYTREVVAQLHQSATHIIEDLSKEKPEKSADSLKVTLDGIVEATLSVEDTRAIGVLTKEAAE